MERKEINKLVFVSIASALVAAFVVGTGLLVLLQARPELFRMTAGVANDRKDAAAVATTDSAIVAAVRKADPAVVAITISKNVPVYERYFESIPFFGGGISVPRVRLKGTQLQEVGGGSGFLVSPDGYIVTNRHVVSDEKAEYTVFTNDGQKYPATVVTRDQDLDIAIIKIAGADFPHLTFADSDRLEVGQTAIAIGNALAEFRNTVSVGVISGLSRSIEASDRQGGTESLERLIQTDAAINPGNSGGPLLDINGDVIGVNVATAGSAENIGFALSGNSVKSIVDSIRR